MYAKNLLPTFIIPFGLAVTHATNFQLSSQPSQNIRHITLTVVTHYYTAKRITKNGTCSEKRIKKKRLLSCAVSQEQGNPGHREEQKTRGRNREMTRVNARIASSFEKFTFQRGDSGATGTRCAAGRFVMLDFSIKSV